MRYAHSFFVLCFLLIIPCSCKHSSDDDGPGILVPTEFEANDISTLEADLTTTSEVITLLLDALSFSGSGGLDPEDPCIVIDTELDGTNFFAEGSLNRCELPTSRYGALSANGVFQMHGTLRPTQDSLDRLEHRSESWIPGISRLLSRAGRASSITHVDSNYVLLNSSDAVVSDVLRSQHTVAEFSKGDLLILDYRAPFSSRRGERLLAEIGAGLFRDRGISRNDDPSTVETLEGRNRDSSESPLYGSLKATFFESFTSQVREIDFQIRLEFDGTNIAKFVIDEDGRRGTLDIATGEVVFLP